MTAPAAPASAPTTPTPTAPAAAPVVTPDQLLAHWQGHRRLTRRVIEAFPENELFSLSLGGMRTFGALALELLTMGAPMVRGMVTGEWAAYEDDATPRPKAALLRQWDEATAEIDRQWAALPAGRFQERMTAFGQYEGQGWDLLFYVIDNEIHHRGQGYVYLRALGVEPPPFFERE